jgi:hypothetical protein
VTMKPGTSLRTASEAIFGSSARGEMDQLSDRDILIVDDDVKLLRKRAQVLKAEGWSVASYTFSKLEALASKRALFIQHLKLEAEVTADQNNRLARLFDSYHPKQRYDRELAANARLADLVSMLPAGSMSELWAADVLYVTVRNFGVLWLAGKQVYLFSFDRILDALCDANLINVDGATSLRQLRFMKCLYRTSEIAPRGRVLATIRQALVSLPDAGFPAGVSVVSPDEVLCSAAPPSNAPAYLILRDLEKRLLAARSLHGNKLHDARLKSLQRWIANPRAYANLAASMAADLRSTLRNYTLWNVKAAATR